MIEREILTPKDIEIMRMQRNHAPSEITKKLYANLALPSYVHGYSLAIEFFSKWFESKFDKGYLKSIYIDGKHVLDDYKKFSLQVLKGENPRARIEPKVDYDYDREQVDLYGAPPELYIRRSAYNQSFFKDYDNQIFLSLQQRAMRMNFACKVRVNTRSMQQDLYNKMEMNFRIGATHMEMMSADFHIPKPIMLSLAKQAGFEVNNDNVINLIDFLEYLNRHSDIPFLFKLRAINQKPEFFIRINGLSIHINTVEKLQLDDGERDGKLDTNFTIEMNAVLTIPIPHYYVYYSAEELTDGLPYKEFVENSIGIYSFNMFDIPRVDDNGWMQAAITDYQTEKDDTEIDLSSLFTGDNVLTRAINHDLTRGISPSHFINILIYRGDDRAVKPNLNIDNNRYSINWKTKVIRLKYPEPEPDHLRIVMYYDRSYLNGLDIELNKYNKDRIQTQNINEKLKVNQ